MGQSVRRYSASGIMYVWRFLNPRFFESLGRNPNKKAPISSAQGRSIRSSRPLADQSTDDPARLVVDMNVAISAALKPEGPQGRWYCSHLPSQPSDTILSESALVLARPELKVRRNLRQQLIQLINNHTQLSFQHACLKSPPIPPTISLLNAQMPLGPTTWLLAISAIFRSSARTSKSLARGSFLTLLLTISSIESPASKC